MTERSDLHFLMCTITFDITSGHPRRSRVKEHIDFSLYPRQDVCWINKKAENTECCSSSPMGDENDNKITNCSVVCEQKSSVELNKVLLLTRVSRLVPSLSKEHLEKAVVKDSRVLLHFKYRSPWQRVGLMLTSSSAAKEVPAGCYRI